MGTGKKKLKKWQEDWRLHGISTALLPSLNKEKHMGKVGWRVSTCLYWFPHSFFQIYLIWALRSRFLFHWSCVCGSSGGGCFCVSWRVVRNKTNWSSWVSLVLCGIVPGHIAEFGKIRVIVFPSSHSYLWYSIYMFI